jgi:hypothetical protein
MPDLAATLLSALVLGGGAALVWNQYEYLRVLRSLGSQPFPVIGLGMTSFLRRPWLLLAGYDRMFRANTARQHDPIAEAARQRFARRNWWIVGTFLALGIAIQALLPLTP